MKRKRGISHWDRMKLDPLPPPKIIEVPLGGQRVVRLSRFDGLVRLLAGHQLDDKAVRIGGSICIPVECLGELLDALKKLRRQRR